ncbi:4888_t:CDS:10 [Acaulospora colombiana]|uniref:4888_t:CDS:1 n=1 Tax=Acaulospora colombiana TaxID=27376 RepID=A0ACA9LJU0_9GLOM|nr:4888_t:CDS:10 [Acaulospora colombiana]
MVYSTKELVDSWLNWDRNENTRAEIQRLWDEGSTEELEKRLRYDFLFLGSQISYHIRKRIEFGTAGLPLALFLCSPITLSYISSQGLCSYISNNVKKAQERGVVVGHDHRYNSERWAQLTAAVFLDAGFKVYLHRDLQTRAAGGVMITGQIIYQHTRLTLTLHSLTASHNPKLVYPILQVYWENAVQPKFSSSWTDVAQSVSANSKIIDCTQDMYENPTNNTIKFVTTPMHGVGNKPVMRALQDIGLTSDCLSVVKEQQNPDPEFPTVSFPNPEEHGQDVLAMKTAGDNGATYILAQDPDADRFAAAEKRSAWLSPRSTCPGEIQAVPEAYEWATFQLLLQRNNDNKRLTGQLAMVASTVSSKMIESMGKPSDAIAGFKYIGNVALQLVEQDFIVPFGYEEAIGFMVETGIRDKDGVSATVRTSSSVSLILGVTGTHPELYGYFETNNSYFICNDPAVIDSIFHRLRNYPSTSPGQHQDTWKGANGATYPSSIGSLKINSIRDLTSGFGYDSTTPTLQPELPLSGGHMVTFRAGSTQNGGAAITLTIRTSGTEPKIKYYLEGQGENRDLIKSVLKKVVEELRTEWMQASQNSLQEP